MNNKTLSDAEIDAIVNDKEKYHEYLRQNNTPEEAERKIAFDERIENSMRRFDEIIARHRASKER